MYKLYLILAALVIIGGSYFMTGSRVSQIEEAVQEPTFEKLVIPEESIQQEPLPESKIDPHGNNGPDWEAIQKDQAEFLRKKKEREAEELAKEWGGQGPPARPDLTAQEEFDDPDQPTLEDLKRGAPHKTPEEWYEELDKMREEKAKKKRDE